VSPSTEGVVRVESNRHGFSLGIPESWLYVPATTDWPAGTYPTGGAYYIDKFAVPDGNFPTVDIVTQRLGDGLSEEAFLAWLDVENAKICTVLKTESVTVDGAEARLQQQRCGYNAWEVALIDGGQVFLIYWLGSEVDEAADRPRLDALLRSFRRG
jgi:hypothetical protein